MARYRLLRIGVLDVVENKRLLPQSGALWDTYIKWLQEGNVPDPYEPPPPVTETLAQVKWRKRRAITDEGLSRVQTRFSAVKDFDTLQLVREILLSVAPAARALTPDISWANDTYQAGLDAVEEVNAAITIADAESVVPNWPAL